LISGENMKRICVYCGSNTGARPEYAAVARSLGILLARKNLELVYGGANVGIMKEIADSVLENGGHVIGVIPRFLENRVLHPGLSRLHVVETMHDRKRLMFDLSDAFIMLPGGLGSLEEFFEVLCWAQLGEHEKPCGLINISGYFDKMLEFLDHAVSEKFMKKEHREIILVDESPELLFEKLKNYKPKKVQKWYD
jgi:uncharacterized protein (TIGR00730 family)